MDSGFQAMDSGLQVLNSSQWDLDSGFQSLVGFPILKAVFRIPKPRIPDSTSNNFWDSGFHKQNFRDSGFHKQNFPDSGFHKQKFSGLRKDSLTWGELKIVYSTARIISTFISLSVVQNISYHFIYLLLSVSFPPSGI